MKSLFSNRAALGLWVSSLTALSLVGCAASCEPPPVDHGPIAAGVTGPLGSIMPIATPEQRETFARGLEVANRRFSRSDGLGPAFNVTFCGSCHEKPVTGGGAGIYRNFFLSAIKTDSGAVLPGFSAGEAGGVIRMYYYPPQLLPEGVEPEDGLGPWRPEDAPMPGHFDGAEPARPYVPDETNIIAQRNPIPFFGVGLIAGLEAEVIEENADPDDLDGDGISGRVNYIRGFPGRFGVKAQTADIEGFIRGPLFNHAGITSDPLTEEQRSRLPVDSSNPALREASLWLQDHLTRTAQAAAPSAPLIDADGVPDPELSTQDLFDLVSFAMLLAAPEPEPLTDTTRRGLQTFDGIGCNKCHLPRLMSRYGPIPVYSDFLLHNMGPELDDGLTPAEAQSDEFRTQPLWGISSVGPYLHDGRAFTLDEAIRFHGGEGERSKRAYEALDDVEQQELLAFLTSLGGNDQFTPGLMPPDEPLAAVGAYGGPSRDLTDDEEQLFLRGRELFDFEFYRSDGLGGPRLNGDSCRACHFEPVFGGAGPRGVNVMRHAILNDDGDFVPPQVGTILHKTTILSENANRPQPEANFFEHRQTPHLFGLGVIETIDDATIQENADPEDFDGDGISGRLALLDGGRVGRFGWKAQVPSVNEFVRDAVTAELGMTMPAEPGMTFGRIHDNDDVPDPEMGLDDVNALRFYLSTLAPPPRLPESEWRGDVARGEEVFNNVVGCAQCHIPSLPGSNGDVPLYSDLLLHDVRFADAKGIEEGAADMREMRTPPLWGLRDTAPYLSSGAADTLHHAITGHHGEAQAANDAYKALSVSDRAALIAFLKTL